MTDIQKKKVQSIRRRMISCDIELPFQIAKEQHVDGGKRKYTTDEIDSVWAAFSSLYIHLYIDCCVVANSRFIALGYQTIEQAYSKHSGSVFVVLHGKNRGNEGCAILHRGKKYKVSDVSVSDDMRDAVEWLLSKLGMLEERCDG